MPLKNHFAWSYTALDMYETCPHSYYRERVVKDIPYVQSSAAKRGDIIHQHIDKAINRGAYIPEEIGYDNVPKLRKLAEAMRVLKKRGYEVLTEHKMCFNNKMQPVSWFDKSAWLRIILDLSAYHPDQDILYVWDWKTGKPRYTSQLALCAAGCFFWFKDYKFSKVNTKFTYIDHPPEPGQKGLFAESGGVFHKPEAIKILKSYSQTLKDIDSSIDNGYWPKVKSWKCGYCSVSDCENNEPAQPK